MEDFHFRFVSDTPKLIQTKPYEVNRTGSHVNSVPVCSELRRQQVQVILIQIQIVT